MLRAPPFEALGKSCEGHFAQPRPPDGVGAIGGGWGTGDGGKAMRLGGVADHEDQLQEIIARASALPVELQVQFREGLRRLSAGR